jgi:crotonobetaine/carnitine-CoA ligase
MAARKLYKVENVRYTLHCIQEGSSLNINELENKLKSEGEVVVRKLEEWACKTPDKVFIFYGEENEEITYRDFNLTANIIGNNLQQLGIKKGDKISVFLRNPLITLKTMYGIWKAGAIFCPINYNYKGRLLSHQINDTGPKVLITEAGLIPVLNDIKFAVSGFTVFVYRPEPGDHDYDARFAKTQLDKSMDQYPLSELLTGNQEDTGIELQYYDLANIIYTSGTTGPAKGVVHSYRWINQYVFRTRSYYKPEDVIYNDLPLYHVGGAFANVAAAVWRGCKVALYDRFSRTAFWERIERSRATKALLLDVMIPWLMNVPETPRDRYNTLNKVHMQPLPEYHNVFAKRFGIDFVTCSYGQTEAGNGFGGIFEEVEEGKGTPPKLYTGFTHDEMKDISRSIGVPVVSGEQKMPKGFMGWPSIFLEAAIFNEHDEECAPGEIGEIAFRPKFPSLIFKEYYGKLAETYEVCRNLWFHTGDAGFKDESGNYYFYDRIGGFIRTKGENISSYQVEDIINRHPDIAVCAAFPVPSVEGEEEDVAVYVVLENGKELSEEELRNWLKKEMPRYMYPRYIRFTDDLPKTPTNKGNVRFLV